jgi:hypothetical protein
MSSDTKRLKAILIENAVYYDAPMNEARLRVFACDLEDLPVEAVEQVYRKLRQEKGRRQMPLPGEVRSQIAPEEVSEEDLARNAVSRLIEAVAKFGWINPFGAKSHIGELGWLVVQREGGWTRVCEELNTDNLPTLRAQWRDLAISLARTAKAGKLHQAPALPQSAEVRALVNGSLKSLT